MEKFNIFAGDLSFFCTEDDLARLFSAFGDVEGAIIRRGKQGDTLHYGFVKMNDFCAENAIRHLQGQYFMGRRIRLNIENGENLKARNKSSHAYPQVHVSFLSSSIRSQVNEDLLTRLFSRFGNVMDCVIKQYNLSVNPHRQSGYGFVYYRTEEEALGAIHAVKNSTIDGIKFDCGFSRDCQPSTHRLMMSPNTVIPPSMRDAPYSSSPPATSFTISQHSSGIPLSVGDGYLGNNFPLSQYYSQHQPPAAVHHRPVMQSQAPTYPSPVMAMGMVQHTPQHYPTLITGSSGSTAPVYGTTTSPSPFTVSPSPLVQNPALYSSAYASYPTSLGSTANSSGAPYFASPSYSFH